MRAIQKEGIPSLSADDPAGFPRKFSEASAQAAQYKVAELPSAVLIDRMETVDVEGNCIHRGVPVDLIEASCIPEEIISVQKSCQLVSFRMPYQVAVLRQFDTFGNTGFHDIDIRISDETEIE